jgi:hypothetical protein
MEWFETNIIDIDDLLCYVTYKSVRIRDRWECCTLVAPRHGRSNTVAHPRRTSHALSCRRLGAISYFFMLIIVIYVFVYQLYFQKSYRTLSAFTGSANIKVLGPISPTFRWPRGGPYCLHVPPALLPTQLARGYNVSTQSFSFYGQPPAPRLECWRWDAADVGAVARGSLNSIFVPT